MVTFLLDRAGADARGPVRRGGLAARPGRALTPTPRWGGLAMFGGVLAGVVMAYQLPALRLAFMSGQTAGEGVPWCLRRRGLLQLRVRRGALHVSARLGATSSH